MNLSVYIASNTKYQAVAQRYRQPFGWTVKIANSMLPEKPSITVSWSNLLCTRVYNIITFQSQNTQFNSFNKSDIFTRCYFYTGKPSKLYGIPHDGAMMMTRWYMVRQCDDNDATTRYRWRNTAWLYNISIVVLSRHRHLIIATSRHRYIDPNSMVR